MPTRQAAISEIVALFEKMIEEVIGESMKNKTKFIFGQALTNLKQKYYWSDTNRTLEGWTGGDSYKSLFHFELFRLKIELWKRL